MNTALPPQAMDQLSPSNFLEMRNRRILKRKVITRLPKYVQDFKHKKLAQKAKQTWKPRDPKPIDSCCRQF